MNELVTLEGTTSLRIALKTGKNHFHILRDIEQLLKKPNLDFQPQSKTYTVEGNNKEYKMYELNERDTLLLVTKYDDKTRAAVLDDWLQLRQEQVVRLNADRAALLESNPESRLNEGFMSVRMYVGVRNLYLPYTQRVELGGLASVLCHARSIARGVMYYGEFKAHTYPLAILDEAMAGIEYTDPTTELLTGE